jgi:hypothetical protein
MLHRGLNGLQWIQAAKLRIFFELYQQKCEKNVAYGRTFVSTRLSEVISRPA